MNQAFCEIAKLGVFCDGVSHSTEKRIDREDKVLVLSLRVQPFDHRLATAIRSVIRSTLFKLNHPDPHGHLRKVDFDLEIPRQKMIIFATPDTVKASIAFDQVKISGVYARTEKNVNGFALCFKATFGPPGARELEYAEHWRNGQAFITFEAAEPSADFDPVEDDDEDEDDGQQRLPDHEFETDAAGRPTDAPAAAAKASDVGPDGDPDAARQKLHSHAEGRKKRAGRQTTH